MNAGTQSVCYRNAWRCAIREIDTNCGRKCFRRLCFISWHALVSHSISVYASPRTHYFTTRISTYVSAWLSNHVIIYVVNLRWNYLRFGLLIYPELCSIGLPIITSKICSVDLPIVTSKIRSNDLQIVSSKICDNIDFQEIYMCFFSFYVVLFKFVYYNFICIQSVWFESIEQLDCWFNEKREK